MNLKEGNWDQFKVESNIHNIIVLGILNKVGTDEKFNQWYTTIETAITNTIPTKDTNTEQKPITSAHLRYIQHKYTQLQHQAKVQGWDKNTYNYYKTLKIALQEEI